MSFDWKKTLATVAPTIATALGGPLAGMAVSMASKALGVDSTDTAIEAALASGSPETFATLKKAEQDFLLELEKLGVEREKIAASDRGSARERQVKTGDVTPQILAYIYTFGFFGTLAAQFYAGMNGIEFPDGVQRTLDMTTGALFAMLFAAKDYFFGSSAGSKQKTELLGK